MHLHTFMFLRVLPLVLVYVTLLTASSSASSPPQNKLAGDAGAHEVQLLRGATQLFTRVMRHTHEWIEETEGVEVPTTRAWIGQWLVNMEVLARQFCRVRNEVVPESAAWGEAVAEASITLTMGSVLPPRIAATNTFDDISADKLDAIATIVNECTEK